MKLLPQVGARLWLWLGQSDLRLAAGPGTRGRIERLPESIPRPERKMKPWRKTWAFRLSTASLFFWGWPIPQRHQLPLALAAPNSLGMDLGLSNFTQSYGLEI